MAFFQNEKSLEIHVILCVLIENKCLYVVNMVFMMTYICPQIVYFLLYNNINNPEDCSESVCQSFYMELSFFQWSYGAAFC